MDNERLRIATAQAYPYCIVAPFVFLPFLPVGFNAVFITTLGIALGGILCGLGALSGPLKAAPRSVALALGAAIFSATWFSLTSLWAANPRLALYSPRAAGLWVLFAVWLTAGALIADGRVVRRTLAAVTAAGVFVAGAAIFETLTVGYQREQGFAAGFLENSTSSGTFLAVALIACAVGLLVSRQRAHRVAYGSAGAVAGVALVMSSSRAAWLGLIAVAVFAACLVLVSVRSSRLWTYSAIPVGVGLGATILAVWAATGGLGAGALQVVAKIGTDRDAIWRSAWAQFIRAPLVGEGIGQFSATIQSGLSGGNTATYDTHNTLLGAALGGGVIGLVAVLVTFFAVSHASVVAVASTGRSRGAAVLASLPVFLLTAGLAAWVDSAALLALSALVGAFLGSSMRNAKAFAGEPSLSPQLLRGAGLLMAAGALALTLVNWGPVGLLYEYGKTDVTKPPTLNEALALRQRLPEARASLFVLSVLKYHLGTGSAEAQRRAPDVLRLVKPDAEVDVTVAMKAVALAVTLGDRSAPSGYALVEELALAGLKADPASGVWYTLCAYDAERRGMSDVAAAQARMALQFPQNEETRERLSAIAGL